MPGLIGFIGPSAKSLRGDDRPERERLTAMARALEPEGRFRIDLFDEPCVGLGRVGLEWVQPGPQPVWDETGAVGVIMEGELHNRKELAALLPSGQQPGLGGDAELLLRLFLAMGDGFARQVNGAFVAAFWDRRNHRLTLMNDRLGLYPLYWAVADPREGEVDGRLLFASGVRALQADPGLRRRVDGLALAQFLTFDHVLGTRTLLEDVHLLTPGSILTWQDGRRQERGYWKPEHPETYTLRTESEWMDGLNHHLRQAVRRQSLAFQGGQAPARSRGSSPGLNGGILLSGGLDSRVILAFLAEQDLPRSFSAFTWGIPGCDDAQYARALAARAGIPYRFIELRPDWLLGGAEEAVRVTDGLGNIVNMHALAIADRLSVADGTATAMADGQRAPVIFKGFLGDAMLGFGIRHFHWARYDPTTWAEAHMQTLRDRGVITFDTAEQRDLFTDSFQAALGNGLMESYALVMSESSSPDMSDQRIVYDFRQRVPRMTLNGVEALRGHALVRLPFADNDLVKFSLTIPPGLRYERRLIKNAFIRDFPAYAQIPSTETGLPLMDNLTTVRRQAENWARWHLRRVIKGVHYPRHRPYKDYGNWFRTVLRPWLEGTLLDRRTLERGYFKPETVRRLVAEHMAGADHTVRLGALMSIELWHRQFIDRNGFEE